MSQMSLIRVLDSDGSSSTVTAITITISTLVDHNEWPQWITLRQISEFPSHSLDLTAENHEDLTHSFTPFSFMG